MKHVWIVLSLFVCVAVFAKGSDSLANSQMPSVITVPAAAQPSAHFDPDAATEGYLAQIPPTARSRSDAYFEGTYWLILWDFMYGVVVSIILLNLRDRKSTRLNSSHTVISYAVFCLKKNKQQ